MSEIGRVIFLALSLGTSSPHELHWTQPLLPLLPFDLPLLLRFVGMIFLLSCVYLWVGG